MKKLILCTAFMCLLAGAASANELEAKVVYDYSNNKVIISTDAGESAKRASLQILNEGFTFEDLNSTEDDIEKIFYVKQADSVTGEFSFVINYGSELDGGLHNGRLVVGDKSVDIEDIKLISAEVFESTVSDINEYAKTENYPNFKDTLYNKGEQLGFDVKTLKKLDTDNCLKSFMQDVKENPLVLDDAISNITRFNTFLLMGALEDAVLDNANSLMADSLLAETEIYNGYKELIKEKDEQEFVTEKMSGNEYQTIEDLASGLAGAILLNEIYYAEGYEDVQNIISEYGDVAGISSVSKNVAKGLIGKDFDTVEELIEEYEELMDNSGSSSGGGGGPTSSGGNKKPSISGTFVGTTVTQNTQNAINKNAFTDIEGVDWAIESINALYDKGIIAGRTAELFEPDEAVTREEFVKLLVCALGYQDEAYTNDVFTDVSDNSWYVSYVNIAYEKNLVNGIGDNMFGSGMLITRQDMSVMIYNALKAEGIECEKTNPVFADADKIAGYAKEAVGTLYSMGIINGVSETEFDPQSHATRAQAAKIIYGVLKALD